MSIIGIIIMVAVVALLVIIIRNFTASIEGDDPTDEEFREINERTERERAEEREGQKNIPKEKWWKKFSWEGTPRQIAGRGLIISLISFFIRTFIDVGNIEGVIIESGLDIAKIKIIALLNSYVPFALDGLISYGQILLLIALIKWIKNKFQKPKDSEVIKHKNVNKKKEETEKPEINNHKEIESSFCSMCSNEIDKDAVFCPKCGDKIR